MSRSYRLIVSCPDQIGIIATVTRCIAENGGTVTEASQHADQNANWFFMRYVIAADSLPFGIETFREKFQSIADQFSMHWQITDSAYRPRVVLMASKEDHCLSDLLYRWRSGDLAFDIPCVISNHDKLRDYVEWHDIPYIHIPVDKHNKQPAFDQVMQTIAAQQADVIVLARYMQILPPDMCATYPGKIINIHHSFLPSFIGAKPYHQAYERGVKLIGATCHYVTEELDAGPIIEQDVIRVTHEHNAKDLVRLGRDVERTVLARGLRSHLEDRVLIHGNKTVVLG